MLIKLKERLSQNSNFVDIMQSILAEQLQGDAENYMDWSRIQSNYQGMWQNFIANDICMSLNIKADQEEKVYRAIVYAHWGKDLEKKMEKAYPKLSDMVMAGKKLGQSAGRGVEGSHVCSKDVWETGFWKKKWDWIDNSPIVEIRKYVYSRMSKFKQQQEPVKIRHSASG
jgi:hypothetical protein